MKYFSHVQLKYLFTVLSSSAGVGREAGMVIAMEAAMHKMEALLSQSTLWSWLGS